MSFANELGRLAQGIRDAEGTNTIKFIQRSQVPAGRKVTYGRLVCDHRPQKKEKNRTRLTMGGDRLDYPHDASCPTADLTTCKLLFNSTISTPGATFIGMDVKDFYLNTPMKRFEYMRLPISIIPQEIIDKYNLRDLAEDGWVYIEIQKGMYGLKQASILANKLLAKRLDKMGYYPCQFTLGLWRHVWQPITFSLVVDDFGIKTVGIQHAKHLKATLERHYKVSVD